MNGEGWPEKFSILPSPLRYLGKLARRDPHPFDAELYDADFCPDYIEAPDGNAEPEL